MSLWADFLSNDGRVAYKWTHYFPAYERHFARYRNLSSVVIEIGCGEGGSLQMWKRYFGPMAQVVGIDIRPECRAYEEDQIAVRIGDQADAGFLAGVVAEFGPPDVVIDDGSHRMADILASFRALYPALAKNGVYLVEDLHTAYWEDFGGGLKREGSFIEVCKELIDELNADHSRGAMTPNEFTANTASMHFYDSLAVFERGRCIVKRAIMSGRPQR